MAMLFGAAILGCVIIYFLYRFLLSEAKAANNPGGDAFGEHQSGSNNAAAIASIEPESSMTV